MFATWHTPATERGFDSLKVTRVGSEAKPPAPSLTCDCWLPTLGYSSSSLSRARRAATLNAAPNASSDMAIVASTDDVVPVKASTGGAAATGTGGAGGFAVVITGGSRGMSGSVNAGRIGVGRMTSSSSSLFVGSASSVDDEVVAVFTIGVSNGDVTSTLTV